MSALEGAPTPTPYITGGGPGLALPNYARPDLAFQQVLTLGPAAGITPSLYYQVPGQYVGVLLLLYFVFRSDSGAGTRALSLSTTIENTGTAFVVPGITLQPASTSYVYTWATNLSSAYNFNGKYSLMPFPPIALAGGSSYTVTNVGNVNGAGDLFTTNTAVVLLIPTGPNVPIPATAQGPVATPVLT